MSPEIMMFLLVVGFDQSIEHFDPPGVESIFRLRER